MHLCSMFPIIQMFRTPDGLPPLFGHFRLDVDAGFDESKGKFSIRAIVRNHFGHLVAATSINIRRPGSILGGEFTAILQGILLCAHHDLSLVLVYSGSLEAVQAVTSSTDFLGPEGVLVNQIKVLLKVQCLRVYFIVRRI